MKVIFFIWGGSGFWSMCSGGGSAAGMVMPFGGCTCPAKSWSVKLCIKLSESHSSWEESSSAAYRTGIFKEELSIKAACAKSPTTGT